MSPRFALALAFIAVSGASAARPKEPPPAVAAGKPVNCLQLNQIRDTHVYDDRTIDFVMNNRAVYRNTLPNSCPELGFEESFAYETSLSELCSVDLITVLRHGGGVTRGATCGLGAFQPVTMAGH